MLSLAHAAHETLIAHWDYDYVYDGRTYLLIAFKMELAIEYNLLLAFCSSSDYYLAIFHKIVLKG